LWHLGTLRGTSPDLKSRPQTLMNPQSFYKKLQYFEVAQKLNKKNEVNNGKAPLPGYHQINGARLLQNKHI